MGVRIARCTIFNMLCPYCYRSFENVKSVKRHIYEHLCPELRGNFVDERTTLQKILDFNRDRGDT
jgi:Zn-finger nucleic acid-binding protein